MLVLLSMFRKAACLKTNVEDEREQKDDSCDLHSKKGNVDGRWLPCLQCHCGRHPELQSQAWHLPRATETESHGQGVVLVVKRAHPASKKSDSIFPSSRSQKAFPGRHNLSAAEGLQQSI